MRKVTISGFSLEEGSASSASDWASGHQVLYYYSDSHTAYWHLLRDHYKSETSLHPLDVSGRLTLLLLLFHRQAELTPG